MSIERAWSSGESFADQAFAAAADAFASTPDSWERAIQAAIVGLFGFLAERAPQTRACMIDRAVASDRRDKTIERFTALLQPGFRAVATPPPPVVAEAIGGGIYELIRIHALERRLERLPAAVPDATVVALTPFLGSDDAIELADSTNAQASR